MEGGRDVSEERHNRAYDAYGLRSCGGNFSFLFFFLLTLLFSSKFNPLLPSF